jgi:hypothetical protein
MRLHAQGSGAAAAALAARAGRVWGDGATILCWPVAQQAYLTEVLGQLLARLDRKTLEGMCAV